MEEPARKTNIPNLNTGLGATNDNTSFRTANENNIPQNAPLQNDIANQLAATKAKKSGQQGMPDITDDQNSLVPEQYPDTPEQNEEVVNNNISATPEQISADEQEDIALSFATNKQRTLQNIQREILELQNRLGEFEKNLNDFRRSNLNGFLSIFRPRINLLIDSLIEQFKKGANSLSDEAKVGYYTGLITTVSSLIGILGALKFFAAFLDAAFIDTFSCLRLVIASCVTCIIPIILVLISPLYITFMAIIFMVGKIPLLKGNLTKNMANMIVDLKGQRTAWEAELAKVKEKVTLKKQIKDLQRMEKQIKRAP